MRAFKNIQTLKTVKENKVSCISKRKLSFFGSFFCMILSLGILGFSLSSLPLKAEVGRITSSWAPNLQDIGKIKFVNTDKEQEQEVFSNISLMAMPFENVYVSKIEDGFEVNGLGSVIVKSCLAGKVKSVSKNAEGKVITISHGKGLVSIYEGLDNACVEAGNKVSKNTPIGVSLNSKIILKVLLMGRQIAGLSVKDGEMMFL